MTTKEGRNHSHLDPGNFCDLMQYRFRHSSAPDGVKGKKFLRDELSLTGMEVSIQKLNPGIEVPFYHQHHQHEELYMFLGGHGEFQVDGEVIPVCEGTVIRVDPDGVRTWRNNSDEPLYYIVIQARANSMDVSDIADGLLVDKQVSWPD